MQQIRGGIQILSGLGMFVLTLILGVSWLVFCFGSVIVGLLLLFLAPGILIAPFTIGFGLSAAVLATGVANWHEGSEPVSPGPPKNAPPPPIRHRVSAPGTASRVPAQAAVESDGGATSDESEGGPAAAQRDMSNGIERTPSWVMDLDYRDAYLKGIQRHALRAAVAHQFIIEKLEDKDIFRLYVQYSGNLEYHGCSFAEQQKEVAALVVNQWQKLSPVEQDSYPFEGSAELDALCRRMETDRA